MVLEHCPCGDVGDILKKERRFSEEVAKIYISEIVLAIEYIHSKGMMYRDLKPDNILLTADHHILLTDFGLSKLGIDDSYSSYSFCGSHAYLAPEML